VGHNDFSGKSDRGPSAVAPANSLTTDMQPIVRSQLKDSSYFVNSESFVGDLIKTEEKFTALVLFDHVTYNCRDIVLHKK
jgi:hypothetical protein